MRVVHVQHANCTHYIGRITSYDPHKHGVNAQLGNPFMIPLGAGDHAKARAKVIAKFEQYARNDPVIMERIRKLPENAVLGCWCKPRACHGDVIVKLWKEMHGD